MKRIIYILAVMLLTGSIACAQSILNSGTIDDVSWTLYDDGKLSLNGSGSISDYSSSSSVPWYQNRSAITSLELNGSIQSIGKYAFYACTNVTQITSNITIPPTLAANTFNSSRLGSITLYVSSMYITDYQNATYWQQMNIVSSDGGNPTGGGGTNAYLSSIYIDGNLLDGFDPYTFYYTVELPEGTTSAPNVSYEAEDPDAHVEVQQADSPDGGQAIITVNSADWGSSNFYKITFNVEDTGGDDTPTVYAEGYVGDGDGLHWIIYNNGQMTFDGVGDIPDYESTSEQPWYEYKGEVTDINLNGQIETVGSYAFSQFYGLNTITLSSTTQYLNSYCFNGCTGLTRVTAPYPDVMPSAEVAFAGLDYTEITLEVPESVVDAYQGAMFWYEFKVVAIGGGSGSGGSTNDNIFTGLVEGSVNWSFDGNTGLLTIYGNGAMPDWIESMAPWGDHLSEITKVHVGVGITYVCNAAFAYCENLTEVVLAQTVDSVGSRLFTTNNSPISMYVQSVTPPGIAEDAFSNAQGLQGCIYLYCYESAYSAYESHPVWGATCLGFVDDPTYYDYQVLAIYVNGLIISGFDPNLYNYNVTLPEGTTEAPIVSYDPLNADQAVTVEQATSPNGRAYVNVAVNGVDMSTYSIYFSVSGGGSSQIDASTVAIPLNSSWRFIMLPLFDGIELGDYATDDALEWAIYDGELRAVGQSGWKEVGLDTTYNQAIGHIVRAVNDTATLRINLAGSSNEQEISIALQKYPAAHAENANWNLLGNPYNAGYDINGLGIESPITVWNGTGYSTYMPGIDEYTLQPFESFFVQTPDSTQVEAIRFMPEFINDSISLPLVEDNISDNPSGDDEIVDAYGALPGYFSVGDGIQVQFAKGNLQYYPYNNEWRFAENQYDYIGFDNRNISETYQGWIDFFGWGTGNNPTNTSSNPEDYSEFVDWGANGISNGGNQENMWRTLSINEWGYLFTSRPNATSLFGFGSINGINGLIVLPDDWSTPAMVTFTPSVDNGMTMVRTYYYNASYNHYSDNSYTIEQWKSMEDAGAVFLPSAGARVSQTQFLYIGENGYYWSSSTSDETNASNISFANNALYPQNYGDIFHGRSVRLVK